MKFPARFAVAGVCAIAAAGLVPAVSPAFARTPTPHPTPVPTPAPMNSCRSLPIQDLAKNRPDLGELETVLTEFEASFENRDARRFRYLVHPSIKLDASKRDPVFEHTFLVYGLEKPKLTRTALFEIHVPNRDNPVADCLLGEVRGVVGPEVQYAALHTVLSASEQVRFLTLFAPIPKALQEANKPKFKMGLVMFHTQVWTHARKTAEKYLEEARKWSGLNEPMTAWVFSEGAYRLLDANPYFTAREVPAARAAVAEYFGRMPSREARTESLKRSGLEWDFEGFTVVFQASGMEPGARFRLKKEESVKELQEKCKAHIGALFRDTKELRDAFRGIECIPYSPGEDGTQAPLAGTVFVSWKEIP